MKTQLDKSAQNLGAAGCVPCARFVHIEENIRSKLKDRKNDKKIKSI